MSSTTPILGAPQVAPNQNNKEQTINDAVLYLENATQATARWDASAGPVEITPAQLAQGFFHVVYGNPTDTTFTVPARSRNFAVRARGDGDVYIRVAGGTVGYRVISQQTQFVSVDTEDLRVVPITVDTTSVQGGLVTKFFQLLDVPSSYTGKGGWSVKVKLDATGLEFIAPSAAPRFIELSDVPQAYAGKAGQYVRVASTETNLEFAMSPNGVTKFKELTDVPMAYGGHGGEVVRVKADESGLEFGAIPNALPTQANQAGKFLTTDGTNPSWATVPGPVDIATFVAGKPAIGETVMRYLAVRNVSIPVNLTGSLGSAATAATSQATFTIQKNGSTVGSITFAPNAATGVFTSSAAISLVPGDILSLIAPAVQDTTLADVSITLTGTR